MGRYTYNNVVCSKQEHLGFRLGDYVTIINPTLKTFKQRGQIIRFEYKNDYRDVILAVVQLDYNIIKINLKNITKSNLTNSYVFTYLIEESNSSCQLEVQTFDIDRAFREFYHQIGKGENYPMPEDNYEFVLCSTERINDKVILTNEVLSKAKLIKVDKVEHLYNWKSESKGEQNVDYKTN